MQKENKLLLKKGILNFRIPKSEIIYMKKFYFLSDLTSLTGAAACAASSIPLSTFPKT